MKFRVLSFLMAFLMVLGLCIIPASAAEQVDYAEDIRFLKAVGISEISSEDAKQAVTRRNAVCMALGLCAKNHPSVAYNNEFSDLSADDADAGKLLYAVQNGLIARTSDHRFLPEGKLSYIDALKLVFNAINYGHMAQNKGKGDAIYYNFANHYNVKVNVTDSAALTVGEFARLVSLAAEAPLAMVSSVSSDGDAFYSINQSVTVLTQYYNIETIEGTVTKNNFTSLYTSEAHALPAITVDGMVLQCDDSVDTQNDKEKKQKFQRNAAIIYNGVAITDDDYDAFMAQAGYIPQNGHVELIKDAGGDYTCVKITNYETYVVQGVDVSGQKIVDKYGNTPLDLEKTENLFVCDINGEPVSFDYIDGMNILSVAASLNGYAAKVIVTADAVEGTFVGRYNDQIQLEGETFTMSQSLLVKIKSNTIKMPSPSEEVVIYLDARGLVAVCEASLDSGWHYGFLIDKAKTHGLSAKLMVKMLTKSGNIGIYDVAKTVIIDGKKYKNDVQGTYDELTSSKVYVPVKYRLNVNDEIKDLDTPVLGTTEDETSIKHITDNEKIKWIDYVSAFSGNIFMKSGAVCFTVPETQTDDERDYSVSTVESSFVKDIEYNISVYGEDPNELVNTVVVKKSATGRSVLSSDVISVVDRVSRGLDTQGNDVWKIYAINNGGSVQEYTIDDTSVYNHDSDSDPLERGDVVRFRANDRREVLAMERVFDNETRTVAASVTGETASDTSAPWLYPSDGDLDVIFHLAYGKTLNLKNNIMQMQYNDATGTIQNYYYMGRVVVVEPNGVRMGSVTDLVFDNTGSISSDILLEMRYMRVRTIVVYKNR